MITAKQELSTALLENTKEINLTELSDGALLQMVQLDLKTAIQG